MTYRGHRTIPLIGIIIDNIWKDDTKSCCEKTT